MVPKKSGVPCKKMFLVDIISGTLWQQLTSLIFVITQVDLFLLYAVWRSVPVWQFCFWFIVFFWGGVFYCLGHFFFVSCPAKHKSLELQFLSCLSLVIPPCLSCLSAHLYTGKDKRTWQQILSTVPPVRYTLNLQVFFLFSFQLFRISFIILYALLDPTIILT